MRAASNVLLRDVNTSLIIEEMYRGTNVIYADFTDYDELAHHCGPERVESFEALDGVDRAIATLIKATDEAPRPYKFIVLSDHGQSLGETFLQRYGVSLGEYIRELMGGRATIVQSKTKAEGSTFVNALLSEITASKGVGPSVARAALASKTDADGTVNLDDVEEEPPVADADDDRGRRLGQPRTRLVHRARPPADGRGARGAPPGARRLGRGASRASGCCWSARRSSAPSSSARRARASSTQDKVEGEDPTELFGPHTIMSLKREDAMVHAPDLLLLSQYDPELGEVAAFEELIGSHGGLGGPQTEPFILHPTEWTLDEEVPLGAPAIYRNIRRWLSSIGIELGPQGAKPAADREARGGATDARSRPSSPDEPGERSRCVGEDPRPVVLHADDGPALRRRDLERLLGARRVVELPLRVVVEDEQAQRRPARPPAYCSIGMSPFELPPARIGCRPIRLQIRTGFIGPSSKTSSVGLVDDRAAVLIVLVAQVRRAADDPLGGMP